MTVSQCIKNGGEKGRQVDKHGEGIFALWETHLKRTHKKYLPSKRGRLISCASWKLVLRMYLQKYIFFVTSFFCAPEGFVSLSFTTWHELNFEHHQLRPLTFYLTNSELIGNSYFGSNAFLVDILTFQASKVFGFKMRQPLALVLEGLAASCSWNIVFVVVLIWVRYCHKQNSCIDFFKLRLFSCPRDLYGLQ